MTKAEQMILGKIEPENDVQHHIVERVHDLQLEIKAVQNEITSLQEKGTKLIGAVQSHVRDLSVLLDEGGEASVRALAREVQKNQTKKTTKKKTTRRRKKA